VAEKEYVYYPGCSLEGTAIEYDMSTRAVFKALGASLKEPEDWSCCGSTPAHSVDHVFAGALAARNLAIVEKMDASTMVTACPACLSALKKSHKRMESSEDFKNNVNDLLDDPYNCGVTSKSALQIIYEDIGPEAVAAKATTAFPDLKIAPYYGCITNRPPEVMEFDSPENPIAMDKLFEAVSLQVCDFNFKVECCGAAFGVPKKKMVNELSSKVLDMVLDAGANCIAVCCQLCHQNLDLRQDQINATMGKSYDIPVLFFTQLLGLACGYSPKELGVDKHNIKADRLIRNTMPVDDFRKQLEEEAKARAREAKKKKREAKKKEA
jgi:heterodisulfide reductase subunit B